MSILELATEFTGPEYADVAQQVSPESAYNDTTYVERQLESAAQVVNTGMETALRLQKLVNVRGRNSANASACRAMVDDYFIGLDDVRQVLKLAKEGDTSATKRIPGILAALQESLDFDTALRSMKGYSKAGEKALPAYVQEVMTGLSGSFDGLCEAVRPFTDVIEVQMQVRNRVNAIGNYQFHGAKAVETPVAPAFNELETSFFEAEPTENTEPTEVRGSVFNQIIGALGNLANSFKRALPRAALTGVLLSVGCTEEPAPMTPPAPIKHVAPIVEAPPAPAPAPAPDWNITDTRDITHAVRSALHDACPSLTKAQLIKEEGKWVHAALVSNTSDLTRVVKHQEAKDTDGTWLGKVSADEMKYGNTIPTDYPGVLASTSATRIAGAHGLNAASVHAQAYTGLPEFSTYTCPSN